MVPVFPRSSPGCSASHSPPGGGRGPVPSKDHRTEGAGTCPSSSEPAAADPSENRPLSQGMGRDSGLCSETQPCPKRQDMAPKDTGSPANHVSALAPGRVVRAAVTLHPSRNLSGLSSPLPITWARRPLSWGWGRTVLRGPGVPVGARAGRGPQMGIPGALCQKHENPPPHLPLPPRHTTDPGPPWNISSR